VAAVVLTCAVTLADRSQMQRDPAWMYEKAGRYDLAAMCWQRVLDGERTIYMAFHWNNDPANYAPGNYKAYAQLILEVEQRYKDCVDKAKMTPAQAADIRLVNDVWLSELVDHEDGGQRVAPGLLATAAEMHGEYTFAESLRRGEARYCRVVGAGYHEKMATEREKTGQTAEAALHKNMARRYTEDAALNDLLAKGDAVLMRLPELKGKERAVDLYPTKGVNPVGWQGFPCKLIGRTDGAWLGKPKEEVAAILKEKGLTHTDENVRLSAVTALGNMGERESVLSALKDASPTVRLAAARNLARLHWAEGWAACANSSDAAVKALIEPRLVGVGKETLMNTYLVTGLLDGLNSKTPGTAAFSQKTLEAVTGQKLTGAAWAEWWKKLGDARSGLARKGVDGTTEVDETIDFGTWWQVQILPKDNPILKYKAPVTVVWEGCLVTPKEDDYRLYAENCGEGRNRTNLIETKGGKPGNPGVYMSRPSVKVTVDGKEVLPHATLAVQDPTDGTRVDFSDPVHLTAGMHRIRVEQEYRSKPTFPDNWFRREPEVRLFWSSNDFLREIVPADRLVTVAVQSVKQ